MLGLVGAVLVGAVLVGAVVLDVVVVLLGLFTGAGITTRIRASREHRRGTEEHGHHHQQPDGCCARGAEDVASSRHGTAGNIPAARIGSQSAKTPSSGSS